LTFGNDEEFEEIENLELTEAKIDEDLPDEIREVQNKEFV
jgi:hypothetical protein